MSRALNSLDFSYLQWTAESELEFPEDTAARAECECADSESQRSLILGGHNNPPATSMWFSVLRIFCSLSVELFAYFQRLKNRIQAFTNFVNIAVCLREQNNFNTLMGIIAGLNTSSVSRLKHTKAGIKSRSMEVTRCLVSSFMDPSLL